MPITSAPQILFSDYVCELDLVFNLYKLLISLIRRHYSHRQGQVYAILDQIFLAGEIEETSKDMVLSRLEDLEKFE